MSYELWVITMWADVDNGGGYLWGGVWQISVPSPQLCHESLNCSLKKKKGTNNRICFLNGRKGLHI